MFPERKLDIRIIIRYKTIKVQVNFNSKQYPVSVRDQCSIYNVPAYLMYLEKKS